MLILALDSALARCSAGLVADGVLRAGRQQEAGRGQAALLPVMVAAVLDEAGVAATDLDLIAVTVGPGSFTGIRAGLALAHGIALGAGVPVVGRDGRRGAGRRAAASRRAATVVGDRQPPWPRLSGARRVGRGLRVGRPAAGPPVRLPWPATRRSRSPPGWRRATPT